MVFLRWMLFLSLTISVMPVFASESHRSTHFQYFNEISMGKTEKGMEKDTASAIKNKQKSNPNFVKIVFASVSVLAIFVGAFFMMHLHYIKS